MNGEHRVANPALERDGATQPALSAGPILPGQPTLVLGRIVAYLGFRREEFCYAGIYRVVSFANCFDLACPPSCDRFLYVLEPLDPAACGLDPGFGIAAHGVAALTPAKAPSTDPRNPA